MKPAKGTPSKVRKTGGKIKIPPLKTKGGKEFQVSKYVDRVRNKRIQDDEKFFNVTELGIVHN